MSNNLYPIFEISPEIQPKPTSIIGYKKSIAFDFEKGDIVTKAGQIQYATPEDSWVQWCIKVLQTQKNACYAYSSKIGVPWAEILALPDFDMQKVLLTQYITETLMNDPYGRTGSVSNFTFDRNGDALTVTCSITGINDSVKTITINY